MLKHSKRDYFVSLVCLMLCLKTLVKVEEIHVAM